jgi:hypothetical protein
MFHIECQLTPYPRLRVCDPVSLGEWFVTFRRHYSSSKRATRLGTQRHIPEEPSNLAQFTPRYVFAEVRDYFTQDIWQTKCLLRRREFPLPSPPPPTAPPADETAQFSHKFVTIINMKFPDSVTKAFNKKLKKIGLQELVPQAVIGWLGCRTVFMFLRRPPSSTFVRLALQKSILIVCMPHPSICPAHQCFLFDFHYSTARYQPGHHMKKNEMVGACGANGANRGTFRGFVGET